MKNLYHIGLDVHKETISIAVLQGDENQPIYERTVSNNTEAVIKILEGFHKKGKTVVAYESGCMGYTLYRAAVQKNIDCRVLAANKVVRSGSDKIKTDKRDAVLIARMIKNCAGESIYIPTGEDEATRDLLRCRGDLKDDMKRTKQQLQKFLLRLGFFYDGDRYWTIRHRKWMDQIQFANHLQKETYEQYRSHIEAIEQRVERINESIVKVATSPQYKEIVDKLRCLKGIDYFIALSIACEVGDFKRFAKAESFMAYLGLVPSEFSSGSKRRQSRITKTGNGHLRKLLIEASWHYRRKTVVSKRLAERRLGMNERVINYADKAMHRLNSKFFKLIIRGKSSQLAVTATARELAGFVWGTVNEVYN